MDIINDRRALHRIPEVDSCLPKTMEYIKSRLSGLSCRVFSPAESSLCAFFDFGAADTLAFRADCDALQVQEESGADYASAHPGFMHACGHDGHTAIALELARRVSRKGTLPHNILLIFQCAEETVRGAQPICDSGVLQKYNVRCVFGLHLWPGLEKGHVFTRENELMARSSELTAEFFGRSAHIAKAHQALDSMAAAVEFYRRAVAMEKNIPARYYRLLKFGRMDSGTVRNAVAAHTSLQGSLRAFQDEVFDAMAGSLATIAADVERETGCRVTLHFSKGAPAVMNSWNVLRGVQAVADIHLLPEPSMTAEDFSCYQRVVPGVFFFLGLGDTPPLHATNFNFDESVLEKGADFFEILAEKYQ